MSLSKPRWIFVVSLAAVLLPGILSCRTAPPPCPDRKAIEAEIRLQKRAIELVPFVVSGADLDAKALSALRASFARDLTNSGVFALVNGDTAADFVLSGELIQTGKFKGRKSAIAGLKPVSGVELRAVFELRSKRDNHLVAVAGALWAGQQLVQQQVVQLRSKYRHRTAISLKI